MNELKIAIIQNSQDFHALEKDWHDLFEKAENPHFFQSFDWLSCVWDCVASERGRKLFVLVGKLGEEVVLIWPLMRDGRQARLLASDKVEYRGPIVAKSPEAKLWLKKAWEYAKSRPDLDVDLFLFQDVRSDSPLARLLLEKGGYGWKAERSSRTICLAGFSSWDDYAQTLPKKMMSDQRRQWRRISECGRPIHFDILEPKEVMIDECLDWLLHNKLIWLQRQNISDKTFGSIEYINFIHSVTKGLITGDFSLIFGKLSVGKKIISAGYGFKHGSTFTFHMFSYDFDWENFSPGRLFLERLVRWCLENGVTEFDLMPGKEGYKTVWANDAFGVMDFIIPRTLRGSAIVQWNTSVGPILLEKEWIKRVYRSLPVGLRQRLGQYLYTYREYAGLLKKI